MLKEDYDDYVGHLINTLDRYNLRIGKYMIYTGKNAADLVLALAKYKGNERLTKHIVEHYRILAKRELADAMQFEACLMIHDREHATKNKLIQELRQLNPQKTQQLLEINGVEFYDLENKFDLDRLVKYWAETDSILIRSL